jgi:hypothetical protein
VVRSAAVTVVLALAAGPPAGLLCKSVCDPQVAAATGCHHPEPDTAAAWVGADACDPLAAVVPALIREDVRRAWSAPYAGHAVLTTTGHSAIRAVSARREGSCQPHRLLERRPLSTHLRI